MRKAAGLDDVRIHDLRHTFASEAVMGGESLPTVGKILGHTQAQTTARSTPISPTTLCRAHRTGWPHRSRRRWTVRVNNCLLVHKIPVDGESKALEIDTVRQAFTKS